MKSFKLIVSIVCLYTIIILSACISTSPLVSDSNVESSGSKDTTPAIQSKDTQAADMFMPIESIEEEMHRDEFLVDFESETDDRGREYIIDPDAEADWFIRNTVQWGYYISFNVDMTSVNFRDPDNHRVNYATYDLVKQG